MKTDSVLSVLALSLSTISAVFANAQLVPSQQTSVHKGDAQQRAQSPTPELAANYGKLPLSFEANEGQSDPEVKFLSRGNGYSLFLTDSAAVLALTKTDTAPHNRLNAPSGSPKPVKAPKIDVVRMELAGASHSLRATGAEPLGGTANYFIGNDPAKWHSNVPTYAKVRYAGVYPGVDLIYYGNQRQLEYDFVVAPGADPKQVRLRFAGAKKLSLSADGDLRVIAKSGEVVFHKPAVYQTKDGQLQRVDGRFTLEPRTRVGFALGSYDPTLPLVIDPVLFYSTYLGGSDEDFANAIALDGSGDAYVAGFTASVDFPLVKPFQTFQQGLKNGYTYAFISKFTADGSALIYSTYLGGSREDGALALAVDLSGSAYLSGYTNSSDFPTLNALQALSGTSALGNTTAFVTKFAPSGAALVWSTYLGGSGQETAYGIALDPAHNVYVTGWTGSTDFPTTASAFEKTHSSTALTAFVSKIKADGSSLAYSTYLGGSGPVTGDFFDEAAYAIAVDSAGNAYVTGETQRDNFPTVNPLQSTLNGPQNAFVSKINPDGSALLYSTYLGGRNDLEFGSDQFLDAGRAIAVDSVGEAVVAGGTQSSDFPTTIGAFQPSNNTSYGSAFVSKLSFDGSSLVYSTYLGGGLQSQANAIALDFGGEAYVAGFCYPPGFPVVDPLQDNPLEVNNAFVSRISPDGSALTFSTTLGGSGSDQGSAVAVDTQGFLYLAGYTESLDFPTFHAYQKTLSANPDAFVTKIDQNGSLVGSATALSVDTNPQLQGKPVHFTIKVAATSGSSIPAGKVSLSIDDAPMSLTLDSTGSVTYVTSSLQAGTHVLQASYPGYVGENLASSTSNTITETITTSPPTATPVFSPTSVTYSSPLTVEITDATGGATIYYTTDGTTPTTLSAIYTVPIVVSATETINAMATAAAYSPSGVASATYTIGAASSLQFVPVTPCRVADTRNPTGPFGGPEPGAGSSREFDIPQSACNIPSTAVAYSLNVTVVPDASLNYLTLWPSGQEQPFVSTLNSDGRVKANAAIVPAGADGGVSVFVTDPTQVILDIDGYFVLAGTTSALAFYPVTPCRVADTRNPAGPLGGPSMPGYTSRAFPILSSACNLPSTAQAYSLNVTTIPFGTLNYLTSWPTGETQPYVSTLNSSTGTVTANAAIVPAGSNGDISIFVSDPTVVILDVNGYFAPPGAGGLSLYTTAPCRVLDTRPNDFFGSAVVNVEASACAPPSAAQAYVLNATVVPVQGGGPLYYLTLWPYQTDQPEVSTLNAYDDVVTSNMAIVPATNGSIDAWADGYTNLILDLSSYFAP